MPFAIVTLLLASQRTLSNEILTIGIGGLVIVILFFLWLRFAQSVRLLGLDIKQQKLDLVADLFVLLAIAYVALFVIELIFPQKIPTNAGVFVFLSNFQYSQFFQGGIQTFIAILRFTYQGSIAFVCYLGYISLNKTIPNLSIPEPPSQPLVSANINSSRQIHITRSNCPRCGHKLIDPHQNTCTNCYADLTKV